MKSSSASATASESRTPGPKPASLVRQLVAEFTGTAFLLASVIGSALMAKDLMGGNEGLELLANALATGTALTVLILMFGPVSGAHFNPAVSLAFLMRGELAAYAFPLFVAAQLVGGVAGVWLAHAMFDEPLLQLGSKIRFGTGQWVGEAVATFALLSAILGLLRRAPAAIPYAVGLIVTAGYWYTSSTSFANPAVTFARMFTQSPPNIRPEDVLPFTLVQFATAAFAVYYWRYLEGAADKG